MSKEQQLSHRSGGNDKDRRDEETGQRIPKAGYLAEAGIGRARAEYSIFEAEAKGPNASLGAGPSAVGVGAMARAEFANAAPKDGELVYKILGKDIKKSPNISLEEAVKEATFHKDGGIARLEIVSISTKAGPVGVKVGLGYDTGANAGLDGVEAKFLGTGFSIGKKNSVAVLGSEVSCSVM